MTRQCRERIVKEIKAYMRQHKLTPTEFGRLVVPGCNFTLWFHQDCVTAGTEAGIRKAWNTFKRARGMPCCRPLPRREPLLTDGGPAERIRQARQDRLSANVKLMEREDVKAG